MQEWIEMELQSSDLGDERLDERFKILLDRLSQKPSVSIPAACNCWSETIAAYRFFDNPRVEPDDVLGPHFDATLNRIAEQDVESHRGTKRRAADSGHDGNRYHAARRTNGRCRTSE